MAELVRTRARGSAQHDIEQAQTLIYDAWEQPDRPRHFALARRALGLSPLCADAWLMLSDLQNLSSAARRKYLVRAVCAGRYAIGEHRFVEARGDFWLVLETRPYMRARHALAEDLWFSGSHQQAIGHLREMLELNSNDNLGLRYILLKWHFWLGDDDAVRRLLHDHRDDGSAYFAYSRALIGFRAAGNDTGARRAAKQANRCNRHVAQYLADPTLGGAPVEFYSPGQESEAAWYAYELRFAWRRTSGAIEWLAGQSPMKPVPARAGPTLH